MSEYDAVSASRRFSVLAKQIADLNQGREEDREQLDQARKEIELLREMVSGLSATVARALDGGKPGHQPAPRWDGLDQAEEAAQLAALRDWVNGVLLVQYPEYTFPACWEGHRAALWELGTIHAEWKRTYADPRGVDLDRVEWFHERWLPGVLSRLNRAINSDGAIGCREHGLSAYGRRGA